MTDPKADDDEVRTILARRTPSYREPLLVAWKWNRGGNRADHERAHVLLTELSRRYPHALHVWYELAFGLVRLGRRDAALGVLEHVGDEFRGLLDEDTLCLWGRCYKDAADESLARGLRADQPAGEATAALADADRLYAVAAARYEQAFDLGKNWFPGINLATLWLIRSGLALWLGPQEAEGSAGRRDDWGGRSEALLRSARDLAGELLRQADGWQERLADDRVWTRATRATPSTRREATVRRSGFPQQTRARARREPRWPRPAPEARATALPTAAPIRRRRTRRPAQPR